MQRKLLAFIAVFSLLLLAIGAPAMAHPGRAHKALGAAMELDFNLGFGDPEAPCPGVTWVGSLDFGRGHHYGLAFFPTAPLVEYGDLVYFEGDWTIYESPFAFEGGVFTECAGGLPDGVPVVDGRERGWGGPTWAFGKGRVIDVHGDDGLARRLDDGGRTFWRGTYEEGDPTSFSGPFWIRPRR